MQKSLGSAKVLLAGAAVVVAACSSTSVDKYPTYDSMCDGKAEQECQVATLCNVPVSACTTVRKQACLDAANTALQAGRKYTTSLAEGCVDVTKDTYAPQNTPITPKKKLAMDDNCARVFAGSIAKGATCASSYDCTGSMICDKGHCGDRVEKKQGDGCSNPGEVCETGSFCQLQGTVSICAPRESSARSCNDTDLCIETLRCDGATHTCTERVPARGQCQKDDDCAADAPYCDAAANNVCSPGLSFANGAVDCRAYGAT